MRRRLDAELVRRGLVSSRSHASELIGAGRVTVAGAPAVRSARQVTPGEPITIMGEPARFVSRAGAKLDAALDHFGVDVRGRRALDAGASTGGFTDCLLQRGAEAVVAVDVGHGQLAWRVRRDARVTVLDRTNVRTLSPDAVPGGPVAITVADLSFISLFTVLPALVALTEPDGDFVLLVKPQFEAGRAHVGRGGIVSDPAVHRDVLRRVARAAAAASRRVRAVMPSPIRGGHGNIEFLVHACGTAVDVPVDALLDAALDAAVDAAHDSDRETSTSPVGRTP